MPQIEELMRRKVEVGKVPAEGDEDDADEDEDDEEAAFNVVDDKTQLEGVYDSRKYDSLNVSPEIKNLFSFISYYIPQMIEIITKIKPFIPDYIPAVGDVDAFIKIPYPDSRMENDLGLTVLDELSIDQSDAAVLQLKLKAISKEVDSSKDSSLQQNIVQSTGTAMEIDNWIENIKHLHETTARPDSVSLARNQQKPDIEELMQEWHKDFETALAVHSIPTPDLGCSLEEYINMLCALLDIPIQTNKIASLHVLFNLYHEFKTLQHFKNLN